jgi:glutamyl-tRNA synthetase
VLLLLRDPEGPYKSWTAHIKKQDQEAWIRRVIVADADNYTNANEFVYRHSYLFSPLRKPASYTPPEDVVELSKGFADIQDWTKDSLMKKMHEIIDARPEGRAGAKDVYHYLRMALTGKEEGMRIYEIMEILGREESLKRLGVKA